MGNQNIFLKYLSILSLFQITQLKIASNPFAKGFRDCDPEECVSPNAISEAMSKMSSQSQGNNSNNPNMQSNSNNQRKTAPIQDSPGKKIVSSPKSSQEIKANAGGGDVTNDGNGGGSAPQTGESSALGVSSHREKSVKSKQHYTTFGASVEILKDVKTVKHSPSN